MKSMPEFGSFRSRRHERLPDVGRHGLTELREDVALTRAVATDHGDDVVLEAGELRVGGDDLGVVPRRDRTGEDATGRVTCQPEIVHALTRRVDEVVHHGEAARADRYVDEAVLRHPASAARATRQTRGFDRWVHDVGTAEIEARRRRELQAPEVRTLRQVLHAQGVGPSRRICSPLVQLGCCEPGSTTDDRRARRPAGSDDRRPRRSRRSLTVEHRADRGEGAGRRERTGIVVLHDRETGPDAAGLHELIRAGERRRRKSGGQPPVTDGRSHVLPRSREVPDEGGDGVGLVGRQSGRSHV